ncbi:hypothetical protein [Streptomyces halstedii]|uniref:hypothetical protein n=1 Tax=Streptomyces halstedii TaxID=1944 RepID=UPI0036B00844
MVLLASVPRPDPQEVERTAVSAIARNLESLLQRIRRPVKLVDHALEVFGQHYGQVTEPAARKAVKLLNSQGKPPPQYRGGPEEDSGDCGAAGCCRLTGAGPAAGEPGPHTGVKPRRAGDCTALVAEVKKWSHKDAVDEWLETEEQATRWHQMMRELSRTAQQLR